MGTICRRVCFLGIGLLLLLSGCDLILVTERPGSTPTPGQVSNPTPSPTVVESESETETKAATPRPEVRTQTLRLAVPPPPVPPEKKPPPPPSKSEQTHTPPPSFAVEPSYPKARGSEPREQAVPPPLSLDVGYPTAQSGFTSVEEAEAASLALDKAIQSGRLLAVFQGTGDTRRMVHVFVGNTSNQPIRVRLTPGMILNPGPQQVQPLLVTEELEFVLKPGESQALALESYCMDSRVPAPLPGQSVDYRFSDRMADGGPQAVRAYQAAQKLAKSSPYRHAITQIAIWKSLNQPVEDKHLFSVLGPASRDPRVRQEVMREVDRVLRSL